jgi:hypothetical protein
VGTWKNFLFEKCHTELIAGIQIIVYENPEPKECAKNNTTERGDFSIGSRLDKEIFGSTREVDTSVSQVPYPRHQMTRKTIVRKIMVRAQRQRKRW